MFADLPLVLPNLKGAEDRARLLSALATEETWLVNLYVDEHSNLDALANYWGRGGRVNQVRPYLESLSKVPGGEKFSIRGVLPPFAQTRLFTYPVPSQNPVEQQRDCHWSAMNFFNTTPNDSFSANPMAVEQEIHDHYHEVYANFQFGDAVLFYTRNGENMKIFHTAIYLAENLIFTKNGRRAADPWMIMKLDEMKDYYPQTTEIKQMYFRRNDLE
jgi:hypothetical protein